MFIKGMGDPLELRDVAFPNTSDMGYADLKIQKQETGQMNGGASHSIQQFRRNDIPFWYVKLIILCIILSLVLLNILKCQQLFEYSGDLLTSQKLPMTGISPQMKVKGPIQCDNSG